MTDPVLSLRTGFELELLAPRGSSRQELAEKLGGVTRFFHTDSEPSLVPGMGHFLHVTPGFAVSSGGRELCSLVDDITITADLEQRAAPLPGWYRLLTDEPRLLRLVTRHADAAAPLETVLDPVASLFGVRVEKLGAAYRVADSTGATVVLAAGLPGERERPCEIVTPPISSDHLQQLEQLLAPARELGFTVPVEAAVHLHVDAEPFRDIAAFANVVRLFALWRPALWALLGTNPRCTRLAPVPQALLALVQGPLDDWAGLATTARACGLTKYADVNLTKVVATNPDRHTLEVRILPGSIHGSEVVAKAALVERLLLRCLDPRPILAPTTADPDELWSA